MSMISFRIGQDKELAKESLILSQVLDNIAQTATIDYERYKGNIGQLQRAAGGGCLESVGGALGCGDACASDPQYSVEVGGYCGGSCCHRWRRGFWHFTAIVP